MPSPPSLPLRKIHLPPAISWWPPAPGWWALAALVGGSALAWWLWRRRRRRSATPKERAFVELRALRGRREEASPAALTRELSVLLRRTCLSLYPRAEVAGLVGEAWLEFLDGILGEPRFSTGAGRALLDGPYRSSEAVDADALESLCEDWIRSLPDAAGPDSAPRRRLFRRPRTRRPKTAEAPLTLSQESKVVDG